MLFGKKKKTEPVSAPAPAPAPSKEIYEFIAKSQDEKTDKALYYSKEHGKNRYRFSE